MTAYPNLRKTDIESLDEALYAASCYAANAEGGSRTVTIMCAIVGLNEHYRIDDGEVGPMRDNATGWDWEPVYVVKAPRRDN
jgi:hypothetical protein